MMKKIFLIGILMLSTTIGFAQDSLQVTYSKSSYIGNYGITCNAATDGWINITVTGGTTPYSFSWSNSATSEDISNLPAGTYSVTVTDAASGSVSANNIQLVEPSVLQISLTPIHISCNGSGDGSLSSNVQGGTPAYSYLWSNSSTESGIDGLSSGSYSLTVTDANGCQASDNSTIIEPGLITITLFSPVNSNGFHVSPGLFDGSINLTVSGGTPTLSYTWNTGQFTEDIDRLGGGTYIVKVEDSKRCFKIDSIILNPEDSLPSDAVPITTRGNWINPALDFIGSRNAAPMIFRTTNTERLRIGADGMVGIGTNNPTEQLQINGKMKAENIILTNVAPIPVYDSNVPLPKKLFIAPNGSLITFSNQTSTLSACPDYDFQMPSVVDWNFKWADAGLVGTAQKAVLFTCPNTLVGIGTDMPAAELYVVGNTFSETMTIGTTYLPNNYRLAVKGNVVCEDVRVQLFAEWPDYVFEKDYPLTSLSELEKYLIEKKHLPEMPTAEDVKENGVFTGEMISKLLKQQEIMLLYIINLNKEIEILKATAEKR